LSPSPFGSAPGKRSARLFIRRRTFGGSPSRREEHLKRIKAREGQKIGGLINLGLGIGLFICFWFLIGPKVAFVGLIPGLIGVALLVYVFYLAGPVE
jgi:hypothetical protein